jgi:PAS domain S-box-containing protein
MTRSLAWLGLLAIVFVVGLTATLNAAPGVHAGSIWGVGLAAGVLLVAPAEQRWYAVTGVAVVGALTFFLADYPLATCIGYGIGIAAETFVAASTITGRWTGRARLTTNQDLGPYAAACTLGGLVGALFFAATAQITGYATAWEVGLAVLLAHVLAFAIGMGLFVEQAPAAPAFPPAHRALIWTSTIAITLVAFVPVSQPAVAFLVIPTLGWMAFSGRIIESVLQLIAVSTIAGALTTEGRGPFMHPAFRGDFTGEFRYVPLEMFLLACTLVSVPLTTAVAAQRQSRAEAHLERDRTARLVTSARGIAIIETDLAGVIRMFSPGAQEILGYTAQEVIGRTAQAFVTDAEVARVADDLGVEPTFEGCMGALPGRSADQPIDVEFVAKDGTPHMLSLIISPVHDEHGELSGSVATGDAVTGRLQTQEALETALDAEREAVRRLTEVDEVKDRFVSSVSHELRTPITNIVGYLEILMDGAYGEPNADQIRAMSRIETNSRRLLTLIDDLLALSSVEILERSSELVPTDLVAVVRRAEEIVRPGMMHRDLRLEIDVPHDPVLVSGDPERLDRLVINLATNAVKFTRDGGRVTLRLRPAAGGVGPVIEVEDTGIGIPEHEQEMLFTRFFRATQAREDAVPGSGLGLSIAKSIAELHGARISATSSYGSGSTFRVEFPATGLPATETPQR